jgi:hypothetical protein
MRSGREGILARSWKRAPLAFLFLTFSTASVAQTPVYPLYGIISAMQQTMTTNDLRIIATTFDYLQDQTISDAEIAVIHQYNPAFKVVLYLNSGPTTSASEVPAVEAARGDLAVFQVASLSAAVSASATSFTLTPRKNQAIVLKASTAPGDFCPASDSTQNYVTWIRIENEFLRIEAFNAASNAITVTRAMGGSTAVSHAAGTPVLSPVYNSTYYPGGTAGVGLRYMFDPAKPLAAEWLANFAGNPTNAQKTLTTTKYDGMWFDTVEASPYQAVDMNGNAVSSWNTLANAPYTPEVYRMYQETRLNTVQNALFGSLGHWPFLLANNMASGTYYSGTGDMRNLLLSTAIKPRPLDGYCIESFALDGDTGPSPNTGTQWWNNVNMLMDAAQNGLAALPMVYRAGIKSPFLETSPQRDQMEMYGYASYLLGVEATGTTKFGIPCLYQANGQRFAQVSPRYYWAIGKPAESRAPSDLDGYKLAGHSTYMRKFTNGLVLVNPATTADTPIALGGTYIDPEAGASVQSITLAATTGKILLNPSESPRRRRYRSN